MATWDDVCEVVITAPNPQWLLQFTRDLVADRLAASAHNLTEIRTVYRWEGEVHDAQEARCTIRTRRELVDAITARARERHPYLVPSVVAIPLVGGNPDYLTWIIDETQEPPNSD
jgi:periplasmic divalent cation tolerance protein